MNRSDSKVASQEIRRHRKCTSWPSSDGWKRQNSFPPFVCAKWIANAPVNRLVEPSLTRRWTEGSTF
eukprot:scaffold23471_cov141-Cylindrotheca_fusiformis.AAC.8